MKVVLFDIDDTLLDFHACALWSMQEVAKDFNLVLPNNPLDIFLPINEALWKEIEAGSLDLEGLRQIRWKKVLKAMNIDFDGLVFEDAFRKKLAQASVQVKDAQKVVSLLSQKYTLGVASNGPYHQQRLRLKKAGLIDYFDYFFVSENVGYSKPDQRFFQHVEKEVNSQDICIIGDSLTADMTPAKHRGWTTIWFTREEMNENSMVDYTISTLDKVCAIL